MEPEDTKGAEGETTPALSIIDDTQEAEDGLNNAWQGVTRFWDRAALPVPEITLRNSWGPEWGPWEPTRSIVLPSVRGFPDQHLYEMQTVELNYLMDRPYHVTMTRGDGTVGRFPLPPIPYRSNPDAIPGPPPDRCVMALQWMLQAGIIDYHFQFADPSSPYTIVHANIANVIEKYATPRVMQIGDGSRELSHSMADYYRALNTVQEFGVELRTIQQRLSLTFEDAVNYAATVQLIQMSQSPLKPVKQPLNKELTPSDVWKHPDVAGLHETVLRNPHDMGIRGILADALEENNEEERAAFIRRQLANPDEKECCSTYDGGVCPNPATNELCPCCRRLVEDGILSEHATANEDIMFVYRRGFAEIARYVEVPFFNAKMPAIMKVAPLVSIKFDNVCDLRTDIRPYLRETVPEPRVGLIFRGRMVPAEVWRHVFPDGGNERGHRLTGNVFVVPQQDETEFPVNPYDTPLHKVFSHIAINLLRDQAQTTFGMDLPQLEWDEATKKAADSINYPNYRCWLGGLGGNSMELVPAQSWARTVAPGRPGGPPRNTDFINGDSLFVRNSIHPLLE